MKRGEWCRKKCITIELPVDGSDTNGEADVPRFSTRHPSSSSAQTIICCVKLTSTLPGLSSSAATSMGKIQQRNQRICTVKENINNIHIIYPKKTCNTVMMTRGQAICPAQLSYLYKLIKKDDSHHHTLYLLVYSTLFSDIGLTIKNPSCLIFVWINRTVHHK